MYRLLIITKDPAVEKMFASMEGWEALGFKPPRIRGSVEEAIACLKKHHIDAIAVDQDEAFAPINAYLDENCPNIPIFPIENSADKQFSMLSEVCQLLNQTHGDHSNDDYGEEYYFNLARERWFKTLICEMTPTQAHVLKRHRLFRCRESVSAPCIYARLSVPSGDAFLSGRWHYGSDRLEIALRNVFGNAHDELAVHIAVASPEEVRVLMCPQGAYDENAQASVESVLSYITETMDQIDQYLGLKMNLIDIRKLENMTGFAAE